MEHHHLCCSLRTPQLNADHIFKFILPQRTTNWKTLIFALAVESFAKTAPAVTLVRRFALKTGNLIAFALPIMRGGSNADPLACLQRQTAVHWISS